MITTYAQALGERLMYFENRVEEINELPGFQIIQGGTILPRKFAAKHELAPYQGMGGVIDYNGKFVYESAIFDLDDSHSNKKIAFGGMYDFTPGKKKKKTAIYLGVANKHWGHFLIDNVQRCWFVLAAGLQNEGNCNIKIDSDLFNDYEYVYSGTGQFENEFVGNYKEFFRLLGIDSNMVCIINEPTEYETIIVPNVSIYPGRFIHSAIKDVFKEVVKNALYECKSSYQTVDKIYFSRLHLPNQRELGEASIENAFKECGYKIMYPEELSLIEQIFYWHTAKEIACINGTIPHNCVFANSDLNLYVVSKMSRVVGYQATMDKIWGSEPTYISAYKEPFNRYPLSVDRGPFWIIMNDNTRRFFDDKYGKDFKISIGGTDYVKYILMCIETEVRYQLRGSKTALKKALIKGGTNK